MKFALISVTFFLVTVSQTTTTRSATAANAGAPTFNQKLLSNFIEMFTGEYNSRVYIYPNGTVEDINYNVRFFPVQLNGFETSGTVFYHYAERVNVTYYRHSLHGVSINDGGRVIVKNYRFKENTVLNQGFTVPASYFQDTFTSDLVENFPHCDNVFSRDKGSTDTFVVSYALCSLEDERPQDPPYLTGLFNCTGFYLTHADQKVFRMEKIVSTYPSYPSYFSTYRKTPKPCGYS